MRKVEAKPQELKLLGKRKRVKKLKIKKNLMNKLK